MPIRYDSYSSGEKFLIGQEKRSCKRKHKFFSLKYALIRLYKYRDNGIKVDNIYKCLFCHCYHIGHNGKRTRERYLKVIRELNKTQKELVI